MLGQCYCLYVFVSYILFESMVVLFCVFKQKRAYEMRISDWSSDVCSSYLTARQRADQFLLVLALEVEATDVGARLDLDAVDVEDVGAAGNFLEDVVVALQLLAALVDVGDVDRRAHVAAARVRLLLPGEHLEQRRSAGAVGAHHAYDA